MGDGYFFAMKKKTFRRSVLLPALIAGAIVIFAFSDLTRISTEVETRMWDSGTTYTSTSQIFYTLDGTLVVRSESPEEMVIKTNRMGEMYVYYPEDNSTEYHQGSDLSSETSQFYLFLHGMTDDLGLRNIGYTQTDTEFEDGHSITYWQPPQEMRHAVGTTKLVHEDYRPIYLAVHDTDDQVQQKTYFHDYTQLMGYDFPQSITTIEYQSVNDSTVSQTSFENIKINDEADSRYFDFEIPDDATLRQ